MAPNCRNYPVYTNTLLGPAAAVLQLPLGVGGKKPVPLPRSKIPTPIKERLLRLHVLPDSYLVNVISLGEEGGVHLMTALLKN